MIARKQPMCRCGKKYKTRQAALNSPAGKAGGLVPEKPCSCGSWHASTLPFSRTTPGFPVTLRPTVRTVPVPAPRKPKPRAAAPKPRRIPARVCRLVDERDSVDGQRCCVHCGATSGLHRHHRRIKGAGGDQRPHTDCPCNLVTLCHRCHRWAHVEDQRAAEDEGLIIARNEEFPGARDVMVHTEGGVMTMRPTCDGRWDEPDTAEGRAA